MMKKIVTNLVLVFGVLLGANDLEKVDFDRDNFNLLCINPYVSELSKKTKVSKAITKGYARQLKSLEYKLSKIDSMRFKYFNEKNKMTKQDKAASRELLEMLKIVNEYYERNDKNKVVVEEKLDDDVGLDDDLDFSESDINELTKKGEATIDKYQESFSEGMNAVAEIYGTKKTDENMWQIYYLISNDEQELVTPNVIFGEYFNPSKRGRRYFLSINIFIFIIDSDGESRVMVQEISDYNWKRNYRFITAQSGKTIQDTIAKMTGIDIK